MNKICTILMIFALACMITQAGDMATYTRSLWTTSSITSNAVSDIINADTYQAASDYYSLQLFVSGTGVIDRCEYQLSNDGTNYIRESGAAMICSNWSATSGPFTNGYGFFKFQPAPARYMRIRVDATGGWATTTAILGIK